MMVLKIENRKQQHSHGHKFDITPVLRAAFYKLYARKQAMLKFEFSNK